MTSRKRRPGPSPRNGMPGSRGGRTGPGLRVKIVAAGLLMTLAAFALSGTPPGDHQQPFTEPGDRTFWSVDQCAVLFQTDFDEDYRGLLAVTGTYSAKRKRFEWSDESPAIDPRPNPTPVAATAGHFLETRREHVVVCRYDPDGNLAFDLVGSGGHSERKATIPLGGPQSSTIRDLDAATLRAPFPTSDGQRDAAAVAAREEDIVRVFLLDAQLDVLADCGVGSLAASSDISLDCADFDGDGKTEIAVGFVPADGKRQLTVQFLEVSDDRRSLQLAGDPVQLLTMDKSHPQMLRFDMASGAFSSPQALELGYAAGRPSQVKGYQETTEGGAIIGFATFDKALHLKSNVKTHPLQAHVATMGINVARGSLRFDPDQGYPLGRHQLVVVGSGFRINTSKAALYGVDYVLAAELDGTKGIVPHESFSRDRGGWAIFGHWENYARPYMALIAVASYKGFGGEAPTAQAIVTVEMQLDSNQEAEDRHLGEVSAFTFDNTFKAKEMKNSGYGFPAYGAATIPADLDGKSLLLGDPIRITFEGIPNLDYLLYEPPKQLDFLPVNPANLDGDWQVVNASFLPDFMIEIRDEEGKTFETSSTDRSSSSWGKSKEKTSKESVSAGFGDMFHAEISHETSDKVSHSTTKEQQKTDQQYASRMFSWSSETNQGDYLRGRLQMIDVWRFPLYNLDVGESLYGFLDFAIPGETRVISGSDKTFADWFQPIHENGNVLSYPVFHASSFTPPDLGTFTLPDGRTVKGLMNQPEIETWDGNQHTWRLEWSEEAGRSEEKSYSHSISHDHDTKNSVSASAHFTFGGVEVSQDVSTSFHQETSWGGARTSAAKNSSSKGIEVNVPSGGDVSWSYQFMPMIYISNMGTFKAIHAANCAEAASGSNWNRYYGRYPDLAVNLPVRFKYSYGEWLAETVQAQRQRMRGLWIREHAVDPVTGEKNLLGHAIAAGSTVEVQGRVYNYSLLTDPSGAHHRTSPFDVRFDYVEIDPSSLDEIGPRTPFDTVRVTAGLRSLEIQTVTATWSVGKDLGGSKPGGSKTYRIYVTVDPKDEVKHELHELGATWTDPDTEVVYPIGNNEGYWPWRASLKVFHPKSETASQDSVPPLDLRAVDSGIEVLPLEGCDEVGEAIVGQAYRLRARIDATRSHSAFVHVLFFEAVCNERGEWDPRSTVLDSNVLFGVSEGENFAWADWTPAETGTYQLSYEIVESDADAFRGNGTTSVLVEVREP